MPPRKRKQSPTLERKIHFYRASVGNDENGLPLPFNPDPALVKINSLPFSDSNGRYLTGEDGNAVCGWIDTNGSQSRMRFGHIRRAGLPQIEQSGTLSDLNIAANAGLVEAIHVIFFPNNIVGADFNFYGPRLSRLGTYLRSKSDGQSPAVTFLPLLRHDVVAQLDHLTDVRLFDLKIHPSYANTVRQADQDLGAAFDAARRVGDTKEIEIIIQPNKNARKSIQDRFISIAKSLGRQSELRTEALKFIVRGKRDDTGRVEAIDLLRDHLIANKKIVCLSERSRALDMHSAYAAIQSAYNELGEDLTTSPGVSS